MKKKFYTGQQVTVKNDLITNETYGGVKLLSSMNIPGKIHKIEGITNSGNYLTKSGFVFSAEMLDEASDFDFAWKPGNIVISKSGIRYFVMSDTLAVGLDSSFQKDKKYVSKIITHDTNHYGLGFNYNLRERGENIDQSSEKVIWKNNNEEILAKICDITSQIEKLNEQLKQLKSQL